MKNKTLKWRLSKLPTSEEVISLVKDKIITQEEAREILFSQETEEDRDEESLKSEIKFLRELVDRLSTKNLIVETIRYIEKPYTKWGWYKPYEVWCGPSNSGNITYLSDNTIYSSITSSNSLSDLNNLM